MAVDLSTYGGRELEIGYEGMVADLNTALIHNKINNGATAIDFGVGVAKTGADTCSAIISSGATACGISLRHLANVNNVGSELKYAVSDAVAIMELGRVLVKPYENVTADSDVYARTSDGRLGVTTSGCVKITGAKWEATATANTLTRVKINS